MQIDETNYIELYYKAIKSGKIKACKKVKKVYKKLYEETQSKGKYHFDVKLGSRPIYFIETFCKQSKGAIGSTLKLELFQKAMIQAVFGIVDETNKRKYNEVMLVLGRKNGKSVLLSALALYMMIGDKEGGAEIDCVASKKDQAKIVFDESKKMVKQSPYLRKIIKKRRSDMYSEYNFSVFQPLSSDSNTLDGLNTHCGIIDELHSLKDRNIYDVVKQGMSARRQPILFIITTGGFNRDGIYDSQYDYAEKVLDGLVQDEHFLPIIYELDSKEEWTDETCWIKANPGLGTIKKKQFLKDMVERAKVDTSIRPTVLVKDFNLKETSSETWLSWEQLNNINTFSMEEVTNTYAIGGCDLSATTDLTCATLLIATRGTNELKVLQHYFLPEKRVSEIEATSSKEAPYRKWADLGLMTLCDGAMVNYSDVTAWFVKMQQEYKIDIWKLGYDRALAGYWADEMRSIFGDSIMEKVAQGPFTWSAPMKELGAQLSDKNINYNNNPILKWCLHNTAVKVTGSLETIQPVKINDSRRIDGLVSLLNAYVIYVKYREDYLNMIGG